MTSDQIDEYDAASDTLIFNTYRLAAQTEDFYKYMIANEMIEQVKLYNGNPFVSLRGYYSNAAVDLNEYVKSNETELQENGINIKLLPTFELYFE